jgi:hypothetical protein
VQTLTGSEKILLALAEFEYLTAHQLTRLFYAPSSLSFVRKQLKALVAASLVVALPRRFMTLPRIYTLTGKGYTATALLGRQHAQRARPSEERQKAQNLFFIQHTLAVSEVLINARLLAHTHPAIVLNRMVTGRALKRKIYVDLPKENRKICIEPDASVDFTINETWHKQTWQDFFHLEVYRHLPPEPRFKQKVHGYVSYATTGQHEALFHTPALSIAVFSATEQQAATLKRWTEEALQEMPHEGQRFFFCSIDPAIAQPTEMYLAPVWQQAFTHTPTPLLLLEEVNGQGITAHITAE